MSWDAVWTVPWAGQRAVRVTVLETIMPTPTAARAGGPTGDVQMVIAIAEPLPDVNLYVGQILVQPAFMLRAILEPAEASGA